MPELGRHHGQDAVHVAHPVVAAQRDPGATGHPGDQRFAATGGHDERIGGQLGQRNRLAPGNPMGRAHHGDHPVAGQRRAHQVGRLAGDRRDVHRTGAQPFQHLAVRPLQHGEPGLRLFGRELTQHGRHDPRVHARHDTEAQLTTEAAGARGIQIAGEPVELVDDHNGPPHRGPAGVGQLHARAVPYHQRHPQLTLQRAQCVAHRGLGDAQLRRRTGHAPALTDRQQHPQLGERHAAARSRPVTSGCGCSGVDRACGTNRVAR